MPKVINFGAVKSPTKYTFTINTFKGVDLTSAPADVDDSRSPDALNMIPDSKGNPSKRTGYELIASYPARINGRYLLGEHELIHAGTVLYLDGVSARTGLADVKSTGQAIEDKLYIFDGVKALVFDGETVTDMETAAYVPLYKISKNADSCVRTKRFIGDGATTTFDTGGGTISSVKVGGTATSDYTYEAEKITFTAAPAADTEIVIVLTVTQEPAGTVKEEINLIGKKWSESFILTEGNETVFSLSFGNLDATAVTVKVLSADGTWADKAENTDFTVDRTSGKVTFLSSPGKTPSAGRDNLEITASRTFSGNADKINKCTNCILYSEAGLSLRLFISGNPDEPNKDYWCAVSDPTYWPATYYSEMGNKDTKIIGYALLHGFLATFISPSVNGRSIYLRKNSSGEGAELSFPVADVLQGEAAISSRGFQFMADEPLFVTARGIFAITAADIDGREYTQNRSYFINKIITENVSDLVEAESGRWRQYYCLSIGEKLYLFDTSQKSYIKGEPNSSFQYEAYIWDNIGARIVWEKDGNLFFGRENGTVCALITDKDAASSYEDYDPDGNKAINGYWTLPFFTGKTFWHNKTIRSIGMQLAPFAQGEIRLENLSGGNWIEVRRWESEICFFQWSATNWKNFTWARRETFRTVTVKKKLKKFDKADFRLVCDSIDKGFGFYGFSIEYSEAGRFKD